MKYKLTDQKLQTYQGFQWVVGEWVGATGGIDRGLCTDSWLHCYDSPLLAVLHNPIHAGIEDPKLWEVEVGGETKDDRGLKCGYRKMKLIREIPLPTISLTQRAAYGILCAKTVTTGKAWLTWADNWLVGVDRAAADATDRAAACAAAYATDRAAADAAAYAADRAAAYAAYAAAYAAADAAAYAAAYAADAAAYAAHCSEDINLVSLAERAITITD